MSLEDFCNVGSFTTPSTIYGAEWRCQTFLTNRAYTISSVKLLLYRSGSVPGDAIVKIQATTGADPYPDGTDLASATFNANALTDNTAGEEKEITFTTPVSLASNTLYAIVIRTATNPYPSLVNLLMRTDNPYANGKRGASSNSGSTWTMSAIADAWFETYSTGLFDEGVKVVSATASVFLISETFTQLVYPEPRPPVDPNKVWDEITGTWVTVDSRGGSRYKTNIVVVGQTDTGNGCIYFSEDE